MKARHLARLHLVQLGVKLAKLSKEQADYLGVPVGVGGTGLRLYGPCGR
jgi:S-adenosylhomocysteine hydrolase